MILFKFIYIVIKTVFFDRIGFCWNGKRLVAFKAHCNKKCLELFQKHESSTFDEFVADFRVIAWVLTGFVFLEYGLFHAIAKNKANFLLYQLAIFFLAALYLSLYGFVTKAMVKSILLSFVRDLAKAVKVAVWVLVALLTIAYAVLSLAKGGQGASAAPSDVVDFFIANGLSWVLWLIVVPAFGATLLLLVFFMLPNLLVRLFVFLFRKIVIKPTLKKSPSDPLRIVSWVIADLFLIEMVVIIIKELFVG